MNLETEAELVQNPALASILLWEFVAEFYYQSKKERGPKIPLILPVLAMTFHQETVASLHSRHFTGGLHLALNENRTLVVDLQERIRAMNQQTMKALNIAFSSKLLAYDRNPGELRPLRVTSPFSSTADDIRRMRNTARRLGYWFSTIGLEQLCQLLRIRI